MARLHNSHGKSASHLNGRIWQAIITTPCEHCGTHECLLSSTDDESHRLAMLLKDMLVLAGRKPTIALTVSPEPRADMSVRSAVFTDAVEALNAAPDEEIAF
jgi:hypothetical protein